MAKSRQMLLLSVARDSGSAMRSIYPLAGLLILLPACTGIHTTTYALTPEANLCQVTEVRVTSLSTLVSGVCWDAEKRPIGMAGGSGKPTISVPLEILSSAAAIAGPVGGAYILGRYLLQSSKEITVGGQVDVRAPQLPAIPPFSGWRREAR